MYISISAGSNNSKLECQHDQNNMDSVNSVEPVPRMNTLARQQFGLGEFAAPVAHVETGRAASPSRTDSAREANPPQMIRQIHFRGAVDFGGVASLVPFLVSSVVSSVVELPRTLAYLSSVVALMLTAEQILPRNIATCRLWLPWCQLRCHLRCHLFHQHCPPLWWWCHQRHSSVSSFRDLPWCRLRCHSGTLWNVIP